MSEGVGGAGRERDRRGGAGERGQREPSLRAWVLRGRRYGGKAPGQYSRRGSCAKGRCIALCIVYTLYTVYVLYTVYAVYVGQASRAHERVRCIKKIDRGEK